MLELIALISTDPLDILPRPQYPSGALKNENPIYLYAYDSSSNPIVRVPYRITDFGQNSIEPGIYEVILSEDYQFLMLAQSKKIYIKIPVITCYEIIQTPEPLYYEKALESKIKKKKRKSNLKDNNTEKNILKQKQQAQLKASIIDSNKGYFILTYKTQFIKAVGYIPY